MAPLSRLGVSLVVSIALCACSRGTGKGANPSEAAASTPGVVKPGTVNAGAVTPDAVNRDGAPAADGDAEPVVGASLLAMARTENADVPVREERRPRPPRDQSPLANTIDPTGDTVSGRAWRLVREKRFRDARDLLERERSERPSDPEVVGTLLALELVEKDAPSPEVLDNARKYLILQPGSPISGTLRLLVSHRHAQAGRLLEAARALGDGNWFVSIPAGLQQADAIAEAAAAAESDVAVLTLSALLDRYTRGALDFEAHRERLTSYYTSLRKHLTPLLFNPAGNWHSREHVVADNESLSRICGIYGAANAGALRLEPGLLQLINRLHNDKITPKQVLRIPVDPFVTVVEKRSFTLKVFLGDAMILLCQVGLGESGKTPATTFTVVDKQEKPTWYRPDGQKIPYGHPENVLGEYFVKFKHPKYQGFGIHGTTDTASIGKERSMGCIRMLPGDLARYFQIVPRKSEVIIRE